MQPVDPGENFGRLVIFGAGQEHVQPLISRVTENGEVFTLWDLSYEERAAILDGARIGLRILTFGPLQPVSLTVEGTPDYFDVAGSA